MRVAINVGARAALSPRLPIPAITEARVLSSRFSYNALTLTVSTHGNLYRRS